MAKRKLKVGDMFCGGGGASQGMAGVEGIELVWAINHDPVAIASHKANHQNVKHYNEDIVELDITKLEKVDLIWMSAECTHFSKAKGGESRDADSRMLAEQIFRYAEHCDPDYIVVENVREFLSWGPLSVNQKGKLVPCTYKNNEGIYYQRWVKKLKDMGYVNYRYQLINSADLGAYTSRVRYFGIFAKKHCAVRFPERTHHKLGEKAGLQPWKAVKDVLDFTDEGKSIFNRPKPLSPRTIERIIAGVKKYVIGVKQEAFISKYYSGNPDSKNISIQSPAGAVTCVDHHSLVNCQFLGKYHGTGNNILSVDGPASTLTCKDRLCKFIVKFNNRQDALPIDQPGPALCTRSKEGICFVLKSDFDNKPVSIEQPHPTLTASRHHTNLIQAEHFLLKYQFNAAGASLGDPCPTVMASRDMYLVSCQYGTAADQPGDCEKTKELKALMREHDISDIKMRMLKVKELKRIQGFPEDYVLMGSETLQKKFIGNAVEVTTAHKIAKTLLEAT